MTDVRPHRRLATAALWTATLWETITLGATGLGKFMNPDFWSIMFAAWGFPSWVRPATGVAEIAGALLLLVPATAPMAALVLGLEMVVALFTVLTNEATLGWQAPALHLSLLSLILAGRLGERRGPAA
jgi:uncharacterized membrane protein YphA (DoxX/SURF4 family)